MPHKLPGALPSPDNALRREQADATPSFVDIDVPLVREQLRRIEIVKAARIYKQGRVHEVYVSVCQHDDPVPRIIKPYSMVNVI